MLRTTMFMHVRAKNEDPGRPSETRPRLRGAQLWLFVLVVAANSGLVACTCSKPAENAERGSAKTDVPAKKAEARKKSPASEATPSEVPDLPEGPIATVEGAPISRERFEELLGRTLRSIEARREDKTVPAATILHFRKEIASRLIWQRVLELEAKSSGVDASAEEIAQAEARAKVENWNEFLESNLESEEAWRERTIATLREKALLRKRADLDASKEEIAKAYAEHQESFKSDQERVWAAHIEVNIGPRSSADAKIADVSRDKKLAASASELETWNQLALTRAQKLRAQVMQGDVDFFEFVRDHSEGPGRFRGGDMGVFDRRRMIPAYTEVVFGMKVGDVSEPLKTDLGYYVIKLLGRWPAGLLPIEAVRADLKRAVESQKTRAAKKALESELYAKYKVVNFMKSDGE
jgi:parvulin-like peptidyl-prolyl isomerase